MAICILIVYIHHSVVDLLWHFHICIMSFLAFKVACSNPAVNAIPYACLSTGFTVRTWFGLRIELAELVHAGLAYVIVTELS